ncbi:hypothetical protein [Methylomicrobium agile]|uniref:hypothetical protein n=1 Tax=Methylomicrobium agile TaxID=39774 RepID=UPI0004DEE309|nr:hypothetical protein [Methylomicrobium agile]
MESQNSPVADNEAVGTKPLTTLYFELIAATQAEQEANKRRTQIEAEVAAHPEVIANLKPSGTSKIGELFEVTTKETRKWDQTKLADLAKGIRPQYWPFKVEHKEVRAQSKTIENKFPELWQEIREALTIVPSKTAVKPLVKG